MKCLDTYALVEIDKGNKNFLKYTQEEFIITSETLAEFVWVLLRDVDELTAEVWYKKLISYCQDVPADILVKAMKFRRKYKNKNLSFFDCVGYVFALEKKFKFVTGDKEFQHLDNVEFVK